jgi:hypothetical protein
VCVFLQIPTWEAVFGDRLLWTNGSRPTVQLSWSQDHAALLWRSRWHCSSPPGEVCGLPKRQLNNSNSNSNNNIDYIWLDYNMPMILWNYRDYKQSIIFYKQHVISVQIINGSAMFTRWQDLQTLPSSNWPFERRHWRWQVSGIPSKYGEDMNYDWW